MPTRMMQRNNLANAFLTINDGPTNEALATAKAEIGDAAWKQGHSPESEGIVRAKLKEHGARYETQLAGRLTGVELAETQANGTTFKKLRVTLENGTDKTILSSNLSGEFAQRLIAKLDKASREHAGQTVTIGGFAEPVERDGKPFVNHVATMKDAQRQEIQAESGHFEKAAAKVKAAQEPMVAAGMGQNKAVMSQIAKATREAYFAEVVQDIQARMRERGVAPAQPEQSGQKKYPRLEAHLQEPDGTWHSVGFYTDAQGKLQGILAVENREQGVKERYPLDLAERKIRDGIPSLQGSVQRENGSKLYVSLTPHENRSTDEKFVSASFGERNPQGEFRQIQGRGGSLKPNAVALEQGEQNRTAAFVKEKLGVDVLARAKEKSKSADLGVSR